RTRAHAHQWKEEIHLLKEEMQQVLAYFNWQAEWWDEQGSRRANLLPALAEGLRAYTARQAFIRRDMANHFEKLWSPL
ncbi:hypothetical protein BJ138DRAFT_1005367, partial [Hygrophoropsis aurantiaca]